VHQVQSGLKAIQKDRDAGKVPDADPSIPKIIHALWLQGRDQAPPMVRANLARWEQLNPEYDLRVIDRDAVRTLLAHTGQDLDRFKPQALANIARLQLLKDHGGVWVDATLYPSQSLNAWLDDVQKPEGFFAFRNPGPDRLLAVWFLVASRNNPMIDLWLKELLRFWEEDHASYPNRKTPDDPVATVAPGQGRADKPYPYYTFAYTFAYLVETNEAFRAMWSRCADLSADPPHALQFALKQKANPLRAELEALTHGCGVHKLNWRFRLHPAVSRALYDERSRETGGVVRRVNRLRDEAFWLASRVRKKAMSVARV